MEPASLRGSVAGSSRHSRTGSTVRVPSEANLSRLRGRLRQSGAIVSSRSVASRGDLQQQEYEVVDVGEGRVPTGVEQLLARLEQHGLRRRLATEDDAAAYAVHVAVRVAEEREESREERHTRSGDASHDGSVQGSSDVAADAREPYYYLCVPCELRLTPVSRRAPPWQALEDVHFHFSSAAHRSTASWMADPDIDETLHSTPLVTPPAHYSRIFVNGIPTLLSRRPGGGDMFYPLPHELHEIRPAKDQSDAHHDGSSSVPTSRASSVGTSNGHHHHHRHRYRLFPTTAERGEWGGAAVLWQRPLGSLFTSTVQLPRRIVDPGPPDPGVNRVVYRMRRRHARARVGLDHVDQTTFEKKTVLPFRVMPRTPVVLSVYRARVAKALLRLPFYNGEERGANRVDGGRGSEVVSKAIVNADDPHRVIYAQSTALLRMGVDRNESFNLPEPPTAREPPVPLTVFEEECYRVALISQEEESTLLYVPPRVVEQPAAAPAAVPAVTDGPPVMLTREMLRQLTGATSQERDSSAGSRGSSSSSSPIGTSMSTDPSHNAFTSSLAENEVREA